MPAKQPDAATVALGETVARLRKARGWQQSDLADALASELGRPIDPTLVTRMELGRRNTAAPEVAALAAVLVVPVSAVLDAKDPFFADGFEDWRRMVELDAARRELARAAAAYGERQAAIQEGDIGEDAGTIAQRGADNAWNREIERQDG